MLYNVANMDAQALNWQIHYIVKYVGANYMCFHQRLVFTMG